MLHDTIAAVSTPHGKGGIAVIRISGEDTAAVLGKCFHTSGPSPAEHPRRACYGSVVRDGEVIDTCIATYFPPVRLLPGRRPQKSAVTGAPR